LFYRHPIDQQYALSIDANVGEMDFRVSAGYDRNASAQQGNDNGRLTLNAQNSVMLLRFLKLSTGLNYAQHNARQDQTLNQLIGLPTYYPYLKLVDEEGNGLAVTR